MSLPNSLNSTQFQADTLTRLERSGVDLKSDAARHVLELAQLLDEQANLVYYSLRQVQSSVERRLNDLLDPGEDGALRLGGAMVQFSAEAQRAEALASEMLLARRMLQMATQNLLDQALKARSTT